MTTTTKTITTPKTDEISFRQQTRLVIAAGGAGKYGALLLVTFVFAFPLFWMISSALKSDPQVYTLPPVWIPIPAHFYNFLQYL